MSEHEITWAVFFGYVARGVAALLPIVNPFSTIPLLLSLTGGRPEQERRKVALAASRNAAIMMVGVMFVGDVVLDFLGISLGALRVAGGLVVAFLGFGLLFPKPLTHVQSAAPPTDDDPALVPLAFPSLCGAGTIALLLTFSSRLAGLSTLQLKLTGYAIGVTVIVISCLVCWMVLSLGSRVASAMGTRGLDALNRVMGLLMVCVGVQFIADGILSIAASAASR
jgi:multiple antibiotic resistance protein